MIKHNLIITSSFIITVIQLQIVNNFYKMNTTLNDKTSFFSCPIHTTYMVNRDINYITHLPEVLLHGHKGINYYSNYFI